MTSVAAPPAVGATAEQQRAALVAQLSTDLLPCVDDAKRMVEEAKAKAQAGAPYDASVEELLAEVEAEVAAVVARLNALEPNFNLRPERSAALVERTAAEGAATHRVLLWSAPAPYQVKWDDGTWYPCVVIDVVQPPTARDRIAYRCWVLGYNVERVAHSEDIRPYQWNFDAPLAPGAACHALHPSGWYFPAVVDRITPSRTAWVTFANDNIDNRVCELPLSLIRVGKHYKSLRKALTEEEKKQRNDENRKRKRDASSAKREASAQSFVQNCSDFMSLRADLGI